jgi:hypothetical protein
VTLPFSFLTFPFLNSLLLLIPLQNDFISEAPKGGMLIRSYSRGLWPFRRNSYAEQLHSKLCARTTLFFLVFRIPKYDDEVQKPINYKFSHLVKFCLNSSIDIQLTRTSQANHYSTILQYSCSKSASLTVSDQVFIYFFGS